MEIIYVINFRELYSMERLSGGCQSVINFAFYHWDYDADGDDDVKICKLSLYQQTFAWAQEEEEGNEKFIVLTMIMHLMYQAFVRFFLMIWLRSQKTSWLIFLAMIKVAIVKVFFVSSWKSNQLSAVECNDNEFSFRS